MDQIDNINTNLESKNNAVQEPVMHEPVDKFNDHLVEDIVMSLPKSKFNLIVNLALKQEYECEKSTPIEPCRFRGNPLETQSFSQGRITNQST